MKKLLPLFITIGLLITGLLILLSNNLVFAENMDVCKYIPLSSCGSIYTSKYSKIFGISIAALGFWYYLFVAMSISIKGFLKENIKSLLESVIFISATLGVVLILPLAIIMLLFVKKFCLYCALTWINNIIILYLVFRHGYAKNFITNLISKLSIKVIFFIVSLALLTFLFSLSIDYSAKKSYQLVVEKTNTISLKNFYTNLKKVEINNDFLKDDEPFAGKVTNKNKIIVYMDFECEHCHEMYNAIAKQIKLENETPYSLFLKNYPLEYSNTKNEDNLSFKYALLSVALRKTNYYKRFILLSSKEKNFKKMIQNLKIKENEIFNSNNINILNNEIKFANKLNLDHTPLVIVNGYIVDNVFFQNNMDYCLKMLTK